MSTNILNPFIIFGQGWTPADLNEPDINLLLDMPLYDTTRLFKSPNFQTTGNANQSLLDGDDVGTIVDAGHLSVQWGNIALTGGTRIPTLETQDGRSCIKGNGTQDYRDIPEEAMNNKQIFKEIWENYDSNWSAQFWIHKATDADEDPIFSSLLSYETASNVGIDIIINTSNQLAIRLAVGSGTYQINMATTKTIVVADGSVPISIVKTGSGIGALSIDIDGTVETFDVALQQATGVPSFPTRIFWNNNYGDFYLSGLRFWDIAIDQAEIDSWKVYNPARTNTIGGYCTTWEIDFNNNANLFTDLAKTTNPTDGQTIKVVLGNEYQNDTYKITRELTEDSVGANWAESIKNSKSAANFALGENYAVSNNGLNSSGWGCSTVIIIGKNESVLLGSHFISDDLKGYMVRTADGYESKEPYSVFHNGDSIDVAATSTINDYFINVFRFRSIQEGSDSWSEDLSTIHLAGASGAHVNGQRIGDPFGGFDAGWGLEGKYLYLRKWNGTLTDAEVVNLINYYKSYYAIS